METKIDFLKKQIHIKEEVKDALASGRPVVALESTIITHGMPYPANVETALEVERIIREQGVIPATIAIINGVTKVGLTEKEIKDLAKEKYVVKASRRDLPVILAKKLSGATTVAGTMLVARMAGIKVFVTGGIGGVHRGATETMDISADLQELAKTNVAVVCAGAKSILDIGLTLEYLETQGVPVLGYQTKQFPAFYTRDSGFNVDYQVESAEEMANIMNIKWNMGLDGGIVIANPIPAEHALDENYINQKIRDALKESVENKIIGKEITPFLLSKLEEITEGKSLTANIELVKHNAKVGALIATEYAKLNKA
ncbi:pseudouridine-5'-phosphate glycosidase [Tepidibacillus sp. HK-1]|uniref:pseudouridine-5'-phosphate glycosidase n=1 Tax=Tepidibacillus sp. HK-1 TaxID=1883407 RepID=UPI0008582535|nr:pseudouridine-5'-phosphate glycosidase [Tepidibacillus sp. HK-1]GBF11007.1 pseudouridine-5'-phosphate glycosidase [Tepidibacillus sp. HK-1]